MNDMGPNARKLFITKMSRDAIPDGGGLADGLKFFTISSLERGAIIDKAMEWTQKAIQLVRTSAEPNPWRAASDEEIAGEILRRIDERAA